MIVAIFTTDNKFIAHWYLALPDHQHTCPQKLEVLVIEMEGLELPALADYCEKMDSVNNFWKFITKIQQHKLSIVN